MSWLKRFLYGIKDYAEDRLDDGRKAAEEAAKRAQEEAARIAQQAQEAAKRAQEEALKRAQDAVGNVTGTLQDAWDDGIGAVKNFVSDGANQLRENLGVSTAATPSPTVTPTPTPTPTPTVTPTPEPAPAPAPTPAPETAAPKAPEPSSPENPTGTVTTQPGTTTASKAPEAAAPAVRPLTQVDISAQYMAEARQKTYDVLNKKFSYNAKSSPLYTILQQQYAKQAEKAAGEAYARSVANTGGYGSSYATLTAEEARRQTMEGFNDQQLALYNAARDEFLQERQSAVDWYNQAKTMYNDALEEEQIGALDLAYETWNGSNEDEVRQILLANGVSASNVNEVLTRLKGEKLSGMQTDAAISDLENDEAYTNAYNAASNIWNGSNEDEVRAALEAQGIPSAMVNQAIRQLKGETLQDKATDADLAAIRESDAYKSAMNTARGLWKSPGDDEAVRAALAEAGADNNTIAQVLRDLKSEYVEDVEIRDYLDDQADEDEAEAAWDEASEMWINGSTNEEIEAALKSQYGAGTVTSIMTALRDQQLTKGEQEDAASAREEEKTRKEAMNMARGLWDDESDEALVRKTLKDAGYDATTIDGIVRELKGETLDDAATDADLAAIRESDAYKSAMNTARRIWVDPKTSEASVRADLLEAGYDKTLVEQIIYDLTEEHLARGEQDAALADQEFATSFNKAYEEALGQWKSPTDDGALRTYLQGKGYDHSVIDNVVRSLNQGYLASLETSNAITTEEYNAQITAAMTEATGLWTGENAAEVRSALEAKYDKAVVNSVLTAMGIEAEEESGVTADDVYNAAAEMYDGTNKTQVQTWLENQGVPEDEAKETIERLEAQEKANLTDAAAQVTDIASAVSYKTSLDAALRNGTLSVEEYDAKIAKNGQVIIDKVTEHLDEPSELDYTALGFTADEWNAMEDDDKILATYEAVGQMAKDGIVTYKQYEDMLTSQVRSEFASGTYKNSKTPARDTADVAIVVHDLYNSGLLRKDAYLQLIDNEILPKVEGTSLFNTVLLNTEKYGLLQSLDKVDEFMRVHADASGGFESDAYQWKHMSDEQKNTLRLLAKMSLDKTGSVTNKPITGGGGGGGRIEEKYES